MAGGILEPFPKSLKNLWQAAPGPLQGVGGMVGPPGLLSGWLCALETREATSNSRVRTRTKRRALRVLGGAGAEEGEP